MDRFRQKSLRSGCGALLLALFIALLIVPGCTTPSLLSKLTHRGTFPKATAENPAVRCLCLWDASEGTGVDNLPARGVSGQIFFFTRGNVSSVEVDGDVRIFLFDDHGSPEEQTQPLHQFDFLAGSWKAQLTSTQFGPAYQLFVPYSRKGHHQTELALRVRLIQPHSPPVFSNVTKVTLPGYDAAKAKSAAEGYEPEKLHRDETASDNFSRMDRITPDKIAETFLQIRAERGEPVSSTTLSGAETSINPRYQRPARRGSARSDNESDGEFNVDDEPNDASDRPVRRHLRQVPHTVEEDVSEDEE